MMMRSFTETANFLRNPGVRPSPSYIHPCKNINLECLDERGVTAICETLSGKTFPSFFPVLRIRIPLNTFHFGQPDPET